VVDVAFWDAEGALVVEDGLEGGDDLSKTNKEPVLAMVATS